MKILYVINSLGTGGAEKQIIALSNEHIKRGSEVMIVRLKDKPDNLLIEAKGVDFRSLKMDTFFGAVSSLFKLKFLINDFNPDIVHSHLPHSIVISRMGKLFLRGNYKLICTAHNYNIRTNLFGFLYKITDFISDFNTNVSQSAVDRYVRKGLFNKKKSEYVPNGFNVKQKYDYLQVNINGLYKGLGFSSDDYICCAIGRLSNQKNYKMMLRAFKIVVDKDPSFKLIILGDGPEKNNLSDEIKNLKLESNIKLLGVVSDVYTYLNLSDLYLMTSLFEGMPLALCEAMIAKKPIVVTNFNGVGEFVKNYYPVIRLDSDNDYARAILKSRETDFSDTVELAYMSVASQYSIESVVDKWIDIYKR